MDAGNIVSTAQWLLLTGLSTLEGVMGRAAPPSEERAPQVSVTAEAIIQRQPQGMSRSSSSSSLDTAVVVSRPSSSMSQDSEGSERVVTAQPERLVSVAQAIITSQSRSESPVSQSSSARSPSPSARAPSPSRASGLPQASRSPSVSEGPVSDTQEMRSRVPSNASSVEPEEEGFADRVRGLATESPFKANAGVLQYCVDMTLGTMVMGVADFLKNLALTVGKVAGVAFCLLGALFGTIIFSELVKSTALFGVELCTINLLENSVGIFESLLRIPPVVGPILTNIARNLIPEPKKPVYYV